MKKIIALLLAAAFCGIMFAGCGDAEDKLDGRYWLNSMESDGETYNLEAMAEEMGEDLEDLSNWYIEFSDGDKLKVNMAGESEEGTFKVSGDTVTLTIDGDDQTGTIDGDKITLGFDDEDLKLVFIKAEG